MKFQSLVSLFAAAILSLSLPVSASSQITTYLGCYTDLNGMKDQGSFQFQSVSYCTDLCAKTDVAFAALRGDSCLCGDSAPAETDIVSDDNCNYPCAGWPKVMCGGNARWSVYAIGDYEKPESSSSAIASTTSSSTSTRFTDPSTTTSSTDSHVITSVTSTSETSTTVSSTSAQHSSENTSSSSASISITPAPSASKANRRSSFLFF
ncbi:hypothetical protein P175DRAFT_0498753 [Aspergillus ochraceoroseus IBT 24754]|uniref:WSC domain-containing protein n=2 Tax=Aspergillus subgen. Nidulantes TaxID=2720870 RepID=A0A0F8X7U3_9EURO|nr:uncharacterized protein P175DRAFT_0498753 [Aspergillus ochraceoroseus IBT 24754]KKK19662.1 hypothetical protein ARAM_001649 [Aspergillus rambellii]PTU25661.1 hypothetical protein P175DRAFT_0498753 [Aspergillus ochraceoroseus IBT 24754]